MLRCEGPRSHLDVAAGPRRARRGRPTTQSTWGLNLWLSGRQAHTREGRPRAHDLLSVAANQDATDHLHNTEHMFGIQEGKLCAAVCGCIALTRFWGKTRFSSTDCADEQPHSLPPAPPFAPLCGAGGPSPFSSRRKTIAPVDTKMETGRAPRPTAWYGLR